MSYSIPSFCTTPAVASLPYGSIPAIAPAAGYGYLPAALPSTYGTYAPAPTVVPVSGAATPYITAPTNTLTALPGGYYGANTVSMTYVTTPITDPHVVSKNPVPSTINVYTCTADSMGAKRRAKRATQYSGPANVQPVYFGCYKPVLKDPHTGASTWFRVNTRPAGALGSFLSY